MLAALQTHAVPLLLVAMAMIFGLLCWRLSKPNHSSVVADRGGVIVQGHNSGPIHTGNQQTQPPQSSTTSTLLALLSAFAGLGCLLVAIWAYLYPPV